MSKLNESSLPYLEKSPTGIDGLDAITNGGLPKGRPTLVTGGAGCGKTLLSVEFLVRGIIKYNEPGVYVCFEETEEEIATNVASLGFDLKKLVAEKKLFLDYVKIERSEIEETGEYDLEGLFVRLGHAIDSIGAKRVVLDTIEALFTELSNSSIIRGELRRLFRWLKDKGVTAIITGERGEGALSRHGLEEYVSDCVIFLDHRTSEQVSIRRIRIVKYRGSVHGTNEYPFLIDGHGFSILPITSLALDHPATSERISSGIPRLDEMLGGKGFFKGSTVLISGTSGTGKTSIAASFARVAAKLGQRCLYFSFEESKAQIFRNMKAIGIDLEDHSKNGKLKILSSRPTLYGLEMHLVMIHQAIEEFKPSIVIIDPITNLVSGGSVSDVQLMLVRLIDYLKMKNITALFTSLTSTNRASVEDSEVGIHSLVDTWILVRDLEAVGERNRALYVLKSRGMHHSNQVREFLITSEGLDLVDVYITDRGVLTGSARRVQQAQDQVRDQFSVNRSTRSSASKTAENFKTDEKGTPQW